MEKNTYRNRLRITLAERELTLREFSFSCGVSYWACSRILNGHVKPRLETAHKMADALNIHISVLFRDTFSYPYLKRSLDLLKSKEKK
ncbi:helix-turn-helix transcriptional regulator [Ammoniphilus sp. CFH 90114]|uniref:helix-turn-helix transcriptional regulator n=1 Tax=Ammoniphilus sp. CFH 90114 TaxID=2493665 RepID=UPI00100F77A0|nr:XRE family transcriptional regulator [Ammoniphilus sp. CFH 90114]